MPRSWPWWSSRRPLACPHDLTQTGTATSQARTGEGRNGGKESPPNGEGTMTSLELASGGTAEFSEGNLYFIGNATTLIRFGGLTILTDPAFLHKGEHVYL